MSEWRYDAGEEGEGDEEEHEDGGWTFQGRTANIFLIDAAPEMFEDLAEEEEDAESAFKKAIKCAHATMMRKIISSDQDLSAVVLFNTREGKNAVDFPNIYVLQELNRPGAERVLQMEEFLTKNEKTFVADYGHSTSANLQDALWVCQSIFSKSKVKLGGQSIMLFTCRDHPHANDEQKQRQARQKAHDLQEAGISLELLHMGNNFDVQKFYKDLIVSDESDSEDTQASVTLADPASRLDELLDRVKRLEHKQRTTSRTSFILAPGVEMSVGVYSAISKLAKPPKRNLWKNTNEEVRLMRKEYEAETGELLMPSDFIKYQVYGGKKIKFTLDECKSLKQVYEQGIELLGFKPMSSIKPFHHVKPPNFIYPDEKSVQGSSKMFAALLARCLHHKVVPIVRFIPRKGAAVAWAALIPQEEELDEKSSQVTPPGFTACYLPFADDFRNIELEKAPRASPSQVDAAKDMIKKIHFKYSPENFDNPDIQTHWSNIEALALNRSQLDEVIDYTVPDNARIKRKAGQLLQKLSVLVYPPGYDPQAVKKRAAPYPSSAAPKRVKLDPGNVDMVEMAKKGQLEKLTMDVLKNWLKDKNIIVAGKRKAQLVQDVMDEVTSST